MEEAQREATHVSFGADVLEGWSHRLSDVDVSN